MEAELLREFMTTKEAADALGYTIQHVRFLIREQVLPGMKLGRDWLVPRNAIASHKRSQIEESATTKAKVTPSTEREVEVLELRAVNVAQVPQLSPFRYPGGKTWLIPYVRQWLGSASSQRSELIEPFAGGGIVSLTAVFENLVAHATLVELDEDVACVWQAILEGGGEYLARKIGDFTPSLEAVRKLFSTYWYSDADRAFATLVRNRVARGGILAPGAGLVKNGENGRGLASRWYPVTLQRRILQIAARRQRLSFIHGDGLEVIKHNAHRTDCVWFVDPPYTVAGRRLYRHSDIDHEALFSAMSGAAGDFLITYDDAPEIRYLAEQHELEAKLIAMKTTHHTTKGELLIGRSLSWLSP